MNLPLLDQDHLYYSWESNKYLFQEENIRQEKYIIKKRKIKKRTNFMYNEYAFKTKGEFSIIQKIVADRVLSMSM